eukprot:1177893-Prorocentrum_minimum.AAC.2
MMTHIHVPIRTQPQKYQTHKGSPELPRTMLMPSYQPIGQLKCLLDVVQQGRSSLHPSKAQLC